MRKKEKEYVPSSYALSLIEEKYPQVVSFIQSEEYPSDGNISNSLLQRKFRLSYNQAGLMIQKLIENGLAESFQHWVGWTVNGVRKEGHEITRYRVFKNPMEAVAK